MLYTAILESGFLKLPLQVIAAVFHHVSQTSPFRHAEIVLNSQAKGKEN